MRRRETPSIDLEKIRRKESVGTIFSRQSRTSGDGIPNREQQLNQRNFLDQRTLIKTAREALEEEQELVEARLMERLWGAQHG